MFFAYSSDGGLTWNEVSSGSVVNGSMVAYAIDSNDVLHVAYSKNADSKIHYKSVTSLAWGSEEAVSTNTASSLAFGLSVAVDSADIPHVAWVRSSDSDVYYSNRSGGTWSAELDLATVTAASVKIVIDSNDYVYVFFRNGTGLEYVKYTSFWTANTVIAGSNVNSSSVPRPVVDSADNVYVIWGSGNTVNYRYVKYTKATDSWGSITLVTTTLAANDPAVMIDASDNISVFFTNAGTKVAHSLNFAAETTIVTMATGIPIVSSAGSPRWPVVGGYETNVPVTGYHFTYIDNTGPSLRYFASADLTLPSPSTQNYSRSDEASPPSGDANLSNAFTPTEYGYVASTDGIYANQTATNEYAFFQFKNKNVNNTDPITVIWIGQSSVAPSASTVALQIYNRNSGLWETLDTESVIGANASFVLTGTQSTSLSDYYDGSYWVSCRVYQVAV